MLSWVAKVVPQPPEPPPKNVEEQKLGKPVATPPVEKKVTFLDASKQQAQKDGKPKQEVQAAESGPEPVAQSGVFTWSTPVSETCTPTKPDPGQLRRAGGKHNNQPDLKKETPAEPEQHTEGISCYCSRGVCEYTPVSVAAPEKPAEPQINVEEREEHTDNRLLPPRLVSVCVCVFICVCMGVFICVCMCLYVCVHYRMLDWIKQGLEKVVPQPKTEVMERTEAPAVAKAPEPAPETKAAPETEK
ncbi:hypothetical protein KUCAC02_020480 [Chaenocephalus aceratus]|nr:hypothetical protein KUCAC02_020480 [Chaenocephalus aceratus]